MAHDLRRCVMTVLLGILTSTAQGNAQEVAPESLGHVDFHVRCASAVENEFNRGVALLHHMTYPVAFASFQAVAEADPGCAMAYWGMAMTLFQPLWPTRPGDEELEQGRALIQQAHGLGSASQRERMFIAAAASFFNRDGEPGYWTRIDRWAEATAEIFEAFPDDLEAQAFFALSHLATASRGGGEPAAHHERAGRVLQGILEKEPTHPGAVHYTIHANDFDGRQGKSLGVVRSYGEIAPLNPHALHMPTHIFVRLGEWDEVISWNERAAEAALAQHVGPGGQFVWDEYPHAVEYLAYAHLQRGDDRSAREVIAAISGASDLQPSFKTAFHLASTAARYAMERHDWPMAAEISVRSPTYIDWDRFWWPEATTWLARGVGSARLGQLNGVAEGLERLRELESLAAAAGEDYFATQIRILVLEVEAWQALALGDQVRAVSLLEAATNLEEETPKHPVTPGPTIPAREMLGDLLAEVGSHQAAMEEYQISDGRTPGRLNTILGLARSAVALGDTDSARRHYRRLLDLSVEGSDRAAVLEARAFLGGT